ncbi:MAG: CoA-binding protein [Bacteroidota bacterium]|jgi:predicted CoA-binding protein
MSENKKTIVLGASPNPERYSFKAIVALRSKGHDVIAVGKRTGVVSDTEIEDGSLLHDNVHTITIYLNATNQLDWYDFIFTNKPKRIIMNPGAENPELEVMASKKGIEVLEACTLVLLATGSY